MIRDREWKGRIVRLTPREVAWLRELLADCKKSSRLNPFETRFTNDLRTNFERWSNATHLTEKQQLLLAGIEEKIHAAG